ncbi:MAG: amino acid adenylation domain-containing protein [Rhodocyclaceae bacterium]|nr:amino acid adenylation domain-containing protein [Rhodocyclaceae bacterium]
MEINANLALAIDRHSRNTPDAPAVVCRGQTLTYSDFAHQAGQIAATLQRDPSWPAAAQQPPRVGILASRSIAACVALMGACWAGATYVPIGLKLPEERILTLLSLCHLSAIIVDDEGAKLLSARVLAACPAIVIKAEQLLAAAAADSPSASGAKPAVMAANDTAYIIFTSGTTGVPKGVMISAGAARHYIAMITQQLDLQASDRALETCELSFDFSVHNMFSTWEAGAALHILPATMVMNAVKFAQNSGLTVWNSVPSLAGMLRQIKALKPDSLSSLRLTIFGGEQLPEGTVTAWQSAAPHSRIFNLYGPTEATVFCLAQGTPLNITPGRGVVAIGAALPGNEAAIFDAQGETVADGTTGELAIAGLQLADGYLGAPELSAARFPIRAGKRWYLTGDLAIKDAAGNFHCLGRIDNQVKVNGYRVELEEIDAHLRVASGAELVGSVAWPVIDGMAHGIVSFIGAMCVDSAAVIADLKTRIPPYMVPSRVVALERMPLNSSGKVDRNALRQWLAQDPA